MLKTSPFQKEGSGWKKGNSVKKIITLPVEAEYAEGYRRLYSFKEFIQVPCKIFIPITGDSKKESLLLYEGFQIQIHSLTTDKTLFYFFLRDQSLYNLHTVGSSQERDSRCIQYRVGVSG
jgi:hypothetical protein